MGPKEEAQSSGKQKCLLTEGFAVGFLLLFSGFIFPVLLDGAAVKSFSPLISHSCVYLGVCLVVVFYSLI